MDTLRTLAKEIIEMFPASRYLHIGGDEAKISDWGNCRDCLEYMKQNGIDGPKPLYTHFVKKMTDMVLELGKTPMVWEGFPRDGADEISRDVIVTAWESYYHLAPELIAEGFKITNSSWQPLYIVPAGHRYVTTGHWEPEEILDWNIYNWQNWNPKTAAYQNPINVDPTDSVLGATLCAWECTYEQEIEPVKRNLAAMSERVWNVSSAPDKPEFLAALDRLVAIAEKLLPKV
jgi:hexosaminidase